MNVEVAAIAIDALVPFPLRVTVPGMLRVCRDPDDDMVLECAVVAGAQLILTGDKDLLSLNPYKGILILTPAEFLADHSGSDAE
jgi:predicted nucleic acid-binding protein